MTSDATTPPTVSDACLSTLTYRQPPIRQWSANERPRERLYAHGASALSDAELLAVLLGNGSVGCDAVATGLAN